MGLEIVLLEYRKSIKNLLTGSTKLRASVNRQLGTALRNGDIPNVDKNGFKLLNGDAVLTSFFKGELTRMGNAKVVEYLFRNSNNMELKRTIAEKMMGNPHAINKYSKLTSRQTTTELKKLGYSDDEIKLLKNTFIKNGKRDGYGFTKPTTTTSPTATTTTSPTATTTTPPRYLFTDVNFWIGTPRSYTNNEIQSFLKTLRKNRRKHSNIINIFNGYAKYMENSTERLKKLIDQRKVTSDLVLRGNLDTEINKELKTIFNKRKEDFKIIVNALDEIAENDKNWRGVWNKIKKGGVDDMYSTLRNLVEDIPLYKKVFYFLGEVLSDFWDQLKATYNIVGKRIKLSAKTREGGFKNALSTGARIGLPKRTNELYAKTFKYGGKTAAYSRYTANLILSTIVFNLTFSFLKNALDGLSNLVYWEDIIGYSEEIKRGERGPYTEKMENLNMAQQFLVNRALNYRTTEEEETNIVNKILLDAVTTEVKENRWDNILQYTKYFPGRYDDIVYIIVSTINTLRKAIDDLKYREQYISNIKSSIAKLQKAAEDAAERIEAEVETQIETRQRAEPGTLEHFIAVFKDENAEDLGDGRFQHSDRTIFKWDGTTYDYE